MAKQDLTITLMRSIDATYQNIIRYSSCNNRVSKITALLDEIATTHFDTDIMQNVYRLKDEVLHNFSFFNGCSELKEISKQMEVFVDGVVHP